VDDLFPVNQPAAIQPVEATNEELIALILADCERYRGAGKSLLDTGREAGKKLLRLKKRFAHGEWENFLAKQFPLTKRTAQRWMREAKKDERKNDTMSLLESSLESYMETTYDEKPASQIAVASELEQSLPPLRDDRLYTAALVGGGVVEVVPVPHASGYFYVAAARELENRDGHVEYTRRGVKLPEAWPHIKRVCHITLSSGWLEEPLRDGLPWYISKDKLTEARRKKVHDLIVKDVESSRPTLSSAELAEKARLEAIIDEELTKLRNLTPDELTKVLALEKDKMDPEIHRVLTRLLLDEPRNSVTSQLNQPTLAERAERIKAMMVDLTKDINEAYHFKKELMKAWEVDPPSVEEKTHFEKHCRLLDWLRADSEIELDDDELRELITLTWGRPIVPCASARI